MKKENNKVLRFDEFITENVNSLGDNNFVLQYDLLSDDFDKIEDSKIFKSRDLQLNKDGIEIEGGQTMFYSDRHYQHEKTGGIHEIKDVIANLKKLNDLNYVYRIKKDVIPFDDEEDDDERSQIIFTLTPIRKK